MRYVTSIERLGIEKGMQQGMQQGERELLLILLEHKFLVVPEHYRQILDGASSGTLLKLGARVLDCQSLDEVFAGIVCSESSAQ